MQLGAVVGEKEVGLVTVLRLMGLRQLAYWTSWVVADLLLGFLTALSIVIWGERFGGTCAGGSAGPLGLVTVGLMSCFVGCGCPRFVGLQQRMLHKAPGTPDS